MNWDPSTSAVFLMQATLGVSALVLKTALLGGVIRVRAQYAPTGTVFDSVGDKDVAGVSYSRMLKRVIRLEGWRGLLKGIVPLALTDIILSMWCPWSYNCMVLPWIIWNPLLDAAARYCIPVLYGVPFTILYVRSITTPEAPSFFNPCRALHAILSPSERRRPWLLYLTPGLFLLIALEYAWRTLLSPDVDKIVARYIPDLPFLYSMSKQGLARLSLALLHAAVLGPLEVVKIRLAIHRHQEQTVALSESQDDIPDDTNSTSTTEAPSAVAEPVVRLRIDADQSAYSGVFSCVQSIVSEEGFETLYRAWWYTVLVDLFKFRSVQL